MQIKIIPLTNTIKMLLNGIFYSLAVFKMRRFCEFFQDKLAYLDFILKINLGILKILGQKKVS